MYSHYNTTVTTLVQTAIRAILYYYLLYCYTINGMICNYKKKRNRNN